jgi:hypothetical protein
MLVNISTYILIVLMLTSCSSTRDITKHPAAKTDFQVGKLYVLRNGVLVFAGKLMPLGTLGSPTTLEKARQNLPSQVEALLEPGTSLLVRKVVTESNPKVGKLTDVYAEVLNGKLKGRLVNLRPVSDANWSTGFTRRDPYFVEAEDP